eukprot:scaffold14154_cov97-Skeletonema_menzelii.AAC.1
MVPEEEENANANGPKPGLGSWGKFPPDFLLRLCDTRYRTYFTSSAAALAFFWNIAHRLMT